MVCTHMIVVRIKRVYTYKTFRTVPDSLLFIFNIKKIIIDSEVVLDKANSVTEIKAVRTEGQYREKKTSRS